MTPTSYIECNKPRATFFAIILVVGTMLGSALTASAQDSSEVEGKWQSDWILEPGYSAEVDTQGYSLPTAIAFVPSPGDRPEDPLYYVTELRGSIKVVTNDRKVHEFASDFFDLTPLAELPEGYGQVGMAGLCLDPVNSYVFATYAYQDAQGILRNDIIRFSAGNDAGTGFGLKPSDAVKFTNLFAAFKTGLAHHIGPCVVDNGTLTVGVGEGWRPLTTQDLNHVNGKILKMNLDGEPLIDNPFYENSDVTQIKNFVWAYGLRNPFSLNLVDGELYMAENGQNVDRFAILEKGRNYRWAGSDNSLAADAEYVFKPAIGPVQMDYIEQGEGLPSDHRPGFYIASSAYAPEQGKDPGIWRIPYDIDQQNLTADPSYFMRYRGNKYMMMSGLAQGPDGIYVAPLFPINGESASVIRISAADANDVVSMGLAQIPDGRDLLIEKGCIGCHMVNNSMGFGSNEGPNLNTDILGKYLEERLNSDAYVDQVKALAGAVDSPHAEWKERREGLLKLEGRERVKKWLMYRIMEPQFDNQYSKMPNQGVSLAQAEVLADYLLPDRSLLQRVKGKVGSILLPSNPGIKQVALMMGLGAIAGGGFVLSLLGAFWVRRRRRQRAGS